MRILPGVLKELLKHVPTVLFEVVDWNELISELPKLSGRMIQKEGYEELLRVQNEFLSPLHIKLSIDPMKNAYKVNKWSSEKCLHLYFAQLFSPHGIFLDLRPHHFYAEPPEFLWHPSALWTCFGEQFQEGLIEVYDGFYLDDEETYFKGLKKIGLVAADWSAQNKRKLGELFKAQFGPSLTTEMSFDLEHFRSSIIKTTHFLLEKKVRISKDFLYLGIYLITLYAHLEEGHEKLSVKEIYLKVREQYQRKN